MVSTARLLDPLSSQCLCTNESVVNYCRNHQRIKWESRLARQSLRNKQAKQPGGNPTQANECRDELYRRRVTLRLPHTSVLSRNFINQFHVTVRAPGKSRTVFGSAFGAKHERNRTTDALQMSVLGKRGNRRSGYWPGGLSCGSIILEFPLA